MGNRTAQMRTVDGQRAVDSTIGDIGAPQVDSLGQIVDGVPEGDVAADTFADAITGALQQVEVPTTFASMIVDMGKSLVQLREERQKLDDQLLADLDRIDRDAEKQRADVRLAYRMAATELGVRLQGVAKAMGA